MHFAEKTLQMNRKYSWNLQTTNPRGPWIFQYKYNTGLFSNGIWIWKCFR